jgi:hypothetical protein
MHNPRHSRGKYHIRCDYFSRAAGCEPDREGGAIEPNHGQHHSRARSDSHIADRGVGVSVGIGIDVQGEYAIADVVNRNDSGKIYSDGQVHNRYTC